MQIFFQKIKVAHDDEFGKDIRIQVKTPVSITEEEQIEGTIMQGEMPHSVMCTYNNFREDRKRPFIKPYKYINLQS